MSFQSSLDIKIPGFLLLPLKSTSEELTVLTLSRRLSTTTRLLNLHSSSPGTSSSEKLASLSSACQSSRLPLQPPATPSYESGNPFKRVSSISDMSYLVNQADHEPTRKGVIVPVQYLDEAEEYLMRALEVFPTSGSRKRNYPNGLMPDLSKQRKPAPKLESEDELTAVCNVAIRDSENLDDHEIVARINLIVKEYKEELLARRIRRLTFICGHKDGSYPGYYTFRGPRIRGRSKYSSQRTGIGFPT